MSNKVNIMGIDVDILNKRYLAGQLHEFFHNESLDVINFITTSMIEQAEKDEHYKELLEVADYLLPGEETLLISYFGRSKELDNVISSYRKFCQTLKRLGHSHKTVFILSENEEDGKLIENYINREYINVTIGGCEVIEDEMSNDRIVNMINAVVPDLLISTLVPPVQEEWISANKGILNSKLFLALGGVMPQIRKNQKEPSKIFQWLKVDKVFQRLKIKEGGKKYKVRIFRKKLEEYNNKKGE